MIVRRKKSEYRRDEDEARRSVGPGRTSGYVRDPAPRPRHAPHRTLTGRLMGDPQPGRFAWTDAAE